MTLPASLTGTGALSRFSARRDRFRIVTWIVSIGVLVVATVASIEGLYPTKADLVQAAIASRDNAAAIAFNGPAQGLDTVGGQVAFQTGSYGLVVVALMTLLMIGRLTRGEEEAGRLELVRALPVGGDAPTASAIAVVAAMDLAVGVLVAVALIALGLPVVGSVVFGLSFTMLGFVFIGVTLVAVQVSDNARIGYGIAGIVLALAFVLRALGDIGDGALSWLSPIGWAQKTRPFAGEVWWPFLVLVVAALGLVAAGIRIGRRRDLGAGLVPPRPGRVHASKRLASASGLAVRLQRGGVVGWGAAVAFTGVAYGAITDSVGEFVRDNETLAELITARTGANLVDSYLAMSFRILALVAACFAIQSVLRLRSEETSLRAELLLATPMSRLRWMGSHLVVAVAGSAVMLALAGVAVGGAAAAVTADVSLFLRSVGAALVYLPALAVVIGVTAALVGLAPRFASFAWAIVALGFVVAMLGQVLDLPEWAFDLSPFEHVSQLPAATLDLTPLLALLAVAVGCTVAGAVGLRRRDLA